MSRLISRDYECQACGDQTIQMISVDHDHWAPRTCELCEGEVHHMPHINVSTEKLSKTVPDVIGSKRFTDVREKRKMDKEAKSARRRGDTEEAKEIKREAGKRGFNIQG